MKPIAKRSVRKAIAIIEDSRQSHIDAIEDPGNQILGNRAFHKLCVKDYEFVLDVLRQILEQ